MQSTCSSSAPSALGYGIAIGLASSILLIAASLKITTSLGPIAGFARLETSLLPIVEGALALWLLSRRCKEPAWLCAVTIYSVFLISSLTRILAGKTSCGCFGALEVRPSAVAALDLGVILLLLVFSPSRRTQLFRTPELRVLLSCGGVYMICSALAPSSPSAIAIAAGLFREVARQDAEEHVIVLPHSWIGAPLPIRDDGYIGGSVMSGKWRLVLYRPDCGECAHVLREHLSRDGLTAVRPDIGRVAFVDVTSSTGSPYSMLLGSNAARLSPGTTWLAQTPLVIDVEDGVVVQVSG